MNTRQFLRAKILGLAARTRRLARINHANVGIRPVDLPYAPSEAHFQAANVRLSRIEEQIQRRFAQLVGTWSSETRERVLVDIALVERELDRARRAFGLFFEVFAQRGTTFAAALAAHDVIAADCYTAVREAAPRIFAGPLLKPLSYMEHGYSPATMRRGVTLSRLLGEPNPFPVIRIPWDREHPWQAVFLHEVAHNLQADLGIWQENRQAVMRRVLQTERDPLLARVYGQWHKEIFADLAALLLGGPAAAWSMADFLAHPAPRTLTFRPGGAHPTAYLRILILAEMLRRMGFVLDAARLARVWRTLYDVNRFHRLPVRLLSTSRHLIPDVVDEIAFQTRRNLAQRALADIIPFGRDDEQAIRASAKLLERGHGDRVDLAPRHLVSAAGYALSQGRIEPQRLSGQVIGRLNEQVPVRARLRSIARVPIAA
ncbi:MAG TPA: hypothetical protein VN289_22745 [Paraburkholderia sp.]|jgi:hypothetical protein|nr:hypothetical protein [Paraburkholderia sp.]